MIHFDETARYTRSNEWAKSIADIIRTGIDDYSQASLGDIVHVEIAGEGSSVIAGQPFGTIEATKSVSDINAPVSGLIIRVNNAVKSTPSLINADPFGEGWLAEISPSDPSELSALMDVASYKAYIL